MNSLLESQEDDRCKVVNAELENPVSATVKINQHSDNINCSFNSKQSSNSRKGKTIPGCAREVIVKVAEICKQEAKKNIPLFSLNAPTKRAAIYSGVSERTIQRIRGEDRQRKLDHNSEVGNKDLVCKKRKVVDYPNKEANYSKIKRQGRRGHVIPNSARDIISRVITSCYKEFEDGEYLAPLICRTRRTALYTGVSVRTIQRIKQEDEVRNKVDQEKLLKTPGKKRKRSTFRDKIDDFDFHCIRMLIDDLILNKKVFPTCSSLLKTVKESKISFPYGEDTLFRLLHSKGFNWRSGRKGKKILVEKEDIFRDRTNCIRKIKKHETEGKLIVYLDDKWIGVDADNTYCDKNDIFCREGTICCSGRLIAFTEFSAMGMVRRNLKIFRPNANYSESKPNVSTVEKWLKENLFPNIPTQSLIIMSTNVYNRNDVNIPNEYSTKPTLIEFIEHKKLKYEHGQTWADLYDIIKNYLESQPRHWTVIDKIIEKHGHIPLRLPIYMSDFNPIELAYTDIKRYLRDKIATAKVTINIIKDVTLQAVENLDNDTFQGYVKHISNMEDYFLQKEKCMQEHYDRVTKKDNSPSRLNAVNEVLLKASDNMVLHKLSSTNKFAITSQNAETVSGSNSTRDIGSDKTLTENMFIPMLPHSQIVYGKTVVTPVDEKFARIGENQELESKIVEPGPSYFNL